MESFLLKCFPLLFAVMIRRFTFLMFVVAVSFPLWNLASEMLKCLCIFFLKQYCTHEQCPLFCCCLLLCLPCSPVDLCIMSFFGFWFYPPLPLCVVLKHLCFLCKASSCRGRILSSIKQLQMSVVFPLINPHRILEYRICYLIYMAMLVV